MKNTVSFTLLVTLCACSQNAMLSNATPGYADGYRAGCKTATAEASNIDRTIVRDQKRYLNDSEYQKGWDTGERSCRVTNDQASPNRPGDVYDAGGVIGPGGQSDGETGAYP